MTRRGTTQHVVGDVEGSETPGYSIVIPCYNEENAIDQTIMQLFDQVDADEGDGSPPYEIVVVDDGSEDKTSEHLARLSKKYEALKVVRHSRNRGYGAALKTGITAAIHDIIVITDADGTYPNDRIPELVGLSKGLDMLVGARVGDDVNYSKIRAIPKVFLKSWVSWIAGRPVPDINSGLRVFKRSAVRPFFPILPDTFSFTTTITLCMLTNYMAVDYIPISYQQRIGSSKIKPVRDTLRFCKLILRTGMYFAPMRLLTPFIVLLGLIALGSGGYDIFVAQNLSDKTTLFVLFTFNTLMFALLADMIDKRSAR
ncbi:MAG: glycosyltransferase family 2 protein [Pseudomonadota bacterium]